jgi:mono/diheme cytochrome c family protein
MRMRCLTTLLGGMFLSTATTAWGQRPTAATGSDTAVVLTPGLIAYGDSVFHGKGGSGVCFSCHGPDGKGVANLAPDLTSGKWLHGDGSYAFIVRTVEKGVPQPKQSLGPMPPMGGATLTPAQVHAVAAYVFSLSHPNARKSP